MLQLKVEAKEVVFLNSYYPQKISAAHGIIFDEFTKKWIKRLLAFSDFHLYCEVKQMLNLIYNQSKVLLPFFKHLGHLKSKIRSTLTDLQPIFAVTRKTKIFQGKIIFV